MKRTLALTITIFGFTCCVLFAQQPDLPSNYPAGLYDESKVPKYTLPETLVTLDGQKVTDTKTWREKRRTEILNLFENHVYGRTMVGRPKEMNWKVNLIDPNAMGGKAVNKVITIFFTAKSDGPKMHLHITLPANTAKPVPIFLTPGRILQNEEVLLNRGYGLADFNPHEIEADIRSGSYEKSIRRFFAKPGQTAPEPNEWGAIGVWAWAMSRAMDYIETDSGIDAKKVCILGFSRYGKVAMWAGAQDERFAIIFSGESGCGGATIVRRGYGETVKSINGYAPHWFNQNFKKYGRQVNDLPVDWHMLIALMAPRPVYIATAEEDYWGDPRGSFLAAKHAEPVYKLFGKKGLEVDEMPPANTPVGDTIGYHMRKGGHAITDYDWRQFLNFADRHFGITEPQKQSP